MESSEKNNLIVGEGVTLTGEVEVPGLLKLHGTIEGNVLGDDVRVGATGCIKGSVKGRNIDIEGDVREKVTSKTLTLRSTASVRGDVEYETIEIEAGARIEGGLHSIDSSEGTPDTAGYVNAEQLIERLSPKSSQEQSGQNDEEKDDQH